jgi:HK97 family phage portal protein
VAIVESSGALLSTHRESLRPSIHRSIELYSGRAQDYAELYRLQPNLRLVIRFLARNIAQLGLKPYRRISATEREELDPRHPLRAFLRNPTPALPRPTSRHAWIRSAVEDLALYDSLYVLKQRNEASGELNGIRIPPTMIGPAGESWLWPDYFLTTGNGTPRRYENDAVMYMHGHNPADPRLGSPPAESLRRILAEEVASGEWREQYWRGAARIPGVITRPVEAPKWSDTARNRWVSDWQAAYSGNGARAGETPVLEEGMEFKNTAFSAKESEYLGARRLTREETAAAYFIPPVFVGILEFANFSNINEQHKSLYSDTLGPWLDWLTEEMELQLVPEFSDVEDVYLEFNIREKLRGRFEEEASATQTATGAPWLTRNEARALSNLPRVDGGDDLVVPLNVLVGGQASPTDSAPPTGALSRVTGKKARNGAMPHYLVGWETQHRNVVSRFFGRQRDSLLSKLGAGHDLASAFDANRWNDELRNDLFGLALSMSAEVGGAVASDFGAEFDSARTEAWLGQNARIAAEGINAATLAELTAATTGVPRTGTARRRGRCAVIDDALAELGLDLAEDDTEDDPVSGSALLDPVRDVFTAAIGVRSLVIAASRATSVGQWSRREGASQAGARQKVWVSSGASNSRHGDLDGETVGLGEAFSNGGQYPGDPALGVDETANCLCSLDFTN